MYEQVSHSLLNDILDNVKPEISKQDLRHFYTRLGANFYAIHSLFERLYGNRSDFKVQGGSRGGGGACARRVRGMSSGSPGVWFSSEA